MDPDSPLFAAFVYAGSGSGDLVLQAVARRLARDGVRLAGMVQVNQRRADRCRCDMILEDLATGSRTSISQDLGRTERGCRLDYGALEAAAAAAAAGLQGRPDLVILSRFGKREAEGGGFRQVIEAAVSDGVPVLVGVSEAHLEAWRSFAGDAGVELGSADEAEAWARRVASLGARAMA